MSAPLMTTCVRCQRLVRFDDAVKFKAPGLAGYAHPDGTCPAPRTERIARTSFRSRERLS